MPLVQVEYVTLPGWKTSICDCRSFQELPENAQNYVFKIEELLGMCASYRGPEKFFLEVTTFRCLIFNFSSNRFTISVVIFDIFLRGIYLIEKKLKTVVTAPKQNIRSSRNLIKYVTSVANPNLNPRGSEPFLLNPKFSLVIQIRIWFRIQ
jgi:hypothetical protein